MRARAATHADVPVLHRLVERAYRGDSARRGWTHEADLLDGQRTDPEALADMLSDPRQAVLLVEEAGALVGCVRVVAVDGGAAELGMLAVEPERQGGGLGAQLIAGAESLAREQFGARRMEMTVIEGRAELVAWYERRGYALTGERRPFPMDDPRFGLPRQPLVFLVLTKALASDTIG